MYRKGSRCWVAKSKGNFQHSLGSCLNLPPSAPEGVLSCPRYVFSWKCVSGSASLLPRLFYFGSQCHVIPLASESPAEGMATACWEQCKSEKNLLVFCSFCPSHSIFNPAFTLNLCWTCPVIPVEMLRSWVFRFGFNVYSLILYFSYYVPFFLCPAVSLRSLKTQQKTSQKHCKSC